MSSLSPCPDPALAPSPADFPPTTNSTLSYANGVYRILTKPLTWHEAVLLCESFNASLTSVLEPYTQAFLTQAVNGVRAPLWIGLANEEVRLRRPEHSFKAGLASGGWKKEECSQSL